MAMQKPNQVFVFYAFNCGEAERHTQRILEQVNGATEVYRSPQSLACRLRQSLHDIIVVVLAINDEKELEQILAFEDLLVGLPVIIVLNRTDSQLVNRCHRLHPRLVDTDQDVIATEAVLRSLYNKHMSQV